jgi:hypothetical protein
MKRLITLLILLLAGPSLANAQTFDATSGSGTADNSGASLAFAGNGFSGSGGAGCEACSNFVFSPGSDFIFRVGDNYPDGSGHLSADISNPPLTQPFDYTAFAEISGSSAGPIPGPGTYHGYFQFDGRTYMAPRSLVEANPTLGCYTLPYLPCTAVDFQASGTLTFDVTRIPNGNGLLEVDNVILTVGAPEPATLALFALGLAGVGLMRRRKAIVPVRTS